jgi:hypothetical protein
MKMHETALLTVAQEVAKLSHIFCQSSTTFSIKNNKSLKPKSYQIVPLSLTQSKA